MQAVNSGDETLVPSRWATVYDPGVMVRVMSICWLLQDGDRTSGVTNLTSPDQDDKNPRTRAGSRFNLTTHRRGQTKELLQEIVEILVSIV